MADGRKEMGVGGSTQMLAFFMEEEAVVISAAAVALFYGPRIQVQNAEPMPSTHAYGTRSRVQRSDSTTYSSAFPVYLSVPITQTMTNTYINFKYHCIDWEKLTRTSQLQLQLVENFLSKSKDVSEMGDIGGILVHMLIGK